MGGGIYSQDVAHEARSSQRDAFSYQAYTVADDSGSRHRSVHPALNPYQKIREVNNETPIVVALDVTRSRGDDTKLMYEKLPMLMGQIALQGYVSNPGISFAAIGDATADQAPLQVGQFEGDNRLDEVVSRMWIEEGGGGTGQESYELAAYFYSRTNCVRLAKGIGKKGYFFFVGDEGFYPKLDKDQVARVIGDELAESLPASEAFRRLQEKFHVFLIYPKKSFSDRKADIDAEIRQRVQAAGGLYDGVDIRASLLWNNRNDLDLHMVTPAGEHIYYGAKKALCGGFLDVDMNVRGETTKPVENVRWAKGTAKPGRYRIYVQNYSFKEQDRAPTPFKVEIEVNGEVRHVEGVISGKGETGGDSSITIAEFDYDPNGRKKPEEKKPDAPDPYAQYSDSVILEQWATVIPREHILRIEDPKAIIDVLLGTLSIASGARDLETYLADLRQRESSAERITQITESLSALTRPPTAAVVEGEVPSGGPERARRSKRL
jgi:hypothetical protein